MSTSSTRASDPVLRVPVLGITSDGGALGACAGAAGRGTGRCGDGLYPTDDVLRAHRPGLAGQLTAFHKYRKRRDAADTEACGERVPPRCPAWRGGSAARAPPPPARRRGPSYGRSTPRRPEIHDERNIVALGVHVESGGLSSTGCPVKRDRRHLPHCGRSVRRVSGTRLTAGQCGQTICSSGSFMAFGGWVLRSDNGFRHLFPAIIYTYK